LPFKRWYRKYFSSERPDNEEENEQLSKELEAERRY